MAIALSGSSSSSDGKNTPGTSSSSSTSGGGGDNNEVAGAVTTKTVGDNGSGSGSSTSSSSSSTARKGDGAENKKTPTTANEMVGGCSVCLDENGFEENSLVYCDGCELAVHQACYGIVRIPPGSWYCCRCASGETKNKSVKCELCPSENGALKRTETGAWAHVLCALYIPEVVFGDTSTMEPINTSKIIRDRYTRICYICEERGRSEATATYGAKISCQHKGGCKKFFHVTCGQTAGLLNEEPSRGSETLNYLGYCKHHFRKSKVSSNNSNNNSNNSKKKGDNNSSTSSNPNSSMLDSASDSSQDNDSRRNNAIEQQDKNNSNRTKVLPNTTNISPPETTTTAPTNTTQSLSSPTLTTGKPTPQPLNDNAPMSLTVPPISGNGSKSNTSAGPTTSTPQKKKRTTKTTPNLQNNTIGQQPNNLGTLLATASDNLSTQPTSANLTTAVAQSTNPRDIYNWLPGIKGSEKSPSKPVKRKPSATPNTQSPNSKSVLLSNQQLAPSSYNPNKIGSPNLSISTSPSLASPSGSTKSTSSSTTTATATAVSSSSSSSSTTSSSPSPALLSPSLTNRASSARLESPLASNLKTVSNLGNKSVASEQLMPANVVAPTALNPLVSSRINLDNPRTDMKKNLAASSSLLSTAVPMTTIESPMQLSMGLGGDASMPLRTSTLGSIDGPVKEANLTTSATTSNTDAAQPTIPPLIIPVPQGSTTSSPTKPTPKTRAPARNTKKKATEVNLATPKPEPKSKPSRSRKTASGDNGAPVSTPVQKAEPKPRKSKANSKVVEAVASSSNANQDGAVSKAAATSTPNKRKSRAASAESNPGATTAAPPAKRIRKKKAATPASSNEPKSTNQTALSLPTNTQSSMGHPTGPGPLMINTPAQNNPLPPGFDSFDGQNLRQKYFSPTVSPYTNYDGPMASSSLSRQSLSRLFTSSSSGAVPANQTNNPQDDPTKAFDDLRDDTLSQVSKFVLEQAQQFDIPMLLGTLYTLREENERLQNRVRDLTLKREQLAAMNARLDLPPQLLTQNLANTNPNFSSIVSNLTNSPKGLPIPSPGSALVKQPLVITSSYNHMGPGHLGFVDRSSPLVAQTHSTINNIKSSSISTPSPPISALMAAHNNSNRAGLTVNQPYMPNSYPQMNATGQINSTPQGSSFYARQ